MMLGVMGAFGMALGLPELSPRLARVRGPLLSIMVLVAFALTASTWLGKAVAGLTAQSKGRSLGIFTPTRDTVKKARAQKRAKEFLVEILGRHVPAINTPEGIRAVNKAKPVDHAVVERYLEGKFGEALPAVCAAMKALAKSFKPDRLAEEAFRLYEEFRPGIPDGVTGWGAKGELDLNRFRALAPEK